MIRAVALPRLLCLHHHHHQHQPLIFTSCRHISQRPKQKLPRSKVKLKQESHEANSERKTHFEGGAGDVTKSAAGAAASTSMTDSLPPQFNELQLDEPPVLFIRKYEQFIDTKGLVLRDELSDIEKNGTITPSSLTSEKIQFLQSAVKTSHTLRQLTEALKKQPEPLHAPPTAVTTQKSVFVDSDFEVVRPDTSASSAPGGSGGKLSLAKFETELEWASSRLEPGKLASHYLMFSKSRLTLLVTSNKAPAPV